VLIHERFFIFTERRFHIVAFSIEIFAVADVPIECFLPQATVTGAWAQWAFQGDPSGGSFFWGGRYLSRHFAGWGARQTALRWPQSRAFGPSGDSNIIILSDSDEEEEVHEEDITDAEATPSSAMNSPAPAGDTDDAPDGVQDDSSDGGNETDLP
jgi:hypothetical protein